MYNQASHGTTKMSPLRLIARITAGMSQLVTMGLVLFGLVLAVPLVGAMADWSVRNSGSTTSGVRPFLWVDSDTPKKSCVGEACGMVTFPLGNIRQPGGTGSTVATVRILWPEPVVINATAGAYLDVVGVHDSLRPSVERGREPSELRVDDSDNDARPLLLANEVQRDGSRRPIMVDAEGFVSAWALEGNDAGAQMTPWAPPVVPDRNAHTQEAAIERGRQWQAMKMHSIQFQPVPTVVDVDVLRAALLEPIPLGHVMMFDWQAGGMLDGAWQQVVPSRSMVGVVIHAQEIGQFLRIKVQIPRSTPYSRGHWLWKRLDGVPTGASVLPNDVRAVFFKPSELLGATPYWWQLEREFLKLPSVNVMRAPSAATDPSCAESAEPPHSCVWVALHGVAVPVQVSVQPLAGGDLSLRERVVFAGKSLRPTDWAAMPREFRREYGSYNAVGPKVSRTVLGVNAPMLLAPQPWLKAGLPVSMAERNSGATP